MRLLRLLLKLLRRRRCDLMTTKVGFHWLLWLRGELVLLLSRIHVVGLRWRRRYLRMWMWLLLLLRRRRRRLLLRWLMISLMRLLNLHLMLLLLLHVLVLILRRPRKPLLLPRILLLRLLLSRLLHELLIWKSF